ncbi:unnamed protein product [Caenorhabditis angaria]|uniref:Sdz-33 F-box domain-containing protein n=1 Tax=Caenorhabditis angaria TaxID=860376 RepID=A0A9P1IDH2_9PELO|nr:unnamed protein product [Caenorhabditis angaria]
MEPAYKRLRFAPTKKIANWSSLSEKVQQIVVDKMDCKTRCKFAICSNSSKTMAYNSENYVYGIGVFNKYQDTVNIKVYHAEDELSYQIMFKKAGAITQVYNFGSDDMLIWNEKNLKMFQVKVLDKFPFGEFNLLSTEKLEKVSILCEDQGDDLLWHECVTVDMLSRVTKLVELHDASLQIEDICKLRADKISLYPASLSAEEVNQFLKKWVNGELHENLRKFHFKIDRYSVMNNKELIEGLRVFDFSHTPYFIMKFSLRSLARPGKIAKIHNTENAFFMIICEDENPVAADLGIIPNIYDPSEPGHLEMMLAHLNGERELDNLGDMDNYFEESDEEFDTFW